MEVFIITGKQGSGKNTLAYRLIGLGKRFTEISANDLYGKSLACMLSEDFPNKLIIDEVKSKNLPYIKNIMSNGAVNISCRVPHTEGTMEIKTFTISELYILSQDNRINEYFRDNKFMHIKF